MTLCVCICVCVCVYECKREKERERERERESVCEQVEVIRWLLSHDHHARPSAKELLQSHLLPLKMEDEQLEEVLTRTMQVCTPSYPHHTHTHTHTHKH